jgi:molybdopterin synthase catalytic subunit
MTAKGAVPRNKLGCIETFIGYVKDYAGNISPNLI